MPDPVVIRPWQYCESERLFDILRRPEVTRWFGEASREPFQDVAQARTKITEWAEFCQAQAPCGIWAVEAVDRDESAGQPVGTVLLFPVPTGENGEVEIGWYLHPDATGHGYATQAVRQVLRHAFSSGYEEVWAITQLDNVASHAVCARVGMRDLGPVEGLWSTGVSQLFVSTASLML